MLSFFYLIYQNYLGYAQFQIVYWAHQRPFLHAFSFIYASRSGLYSWAAQIDSSFLLVGVRVDYCLLWFQMVLLNTVHSNALPITCIVVCYLYPTLNKVGWVMMFAPSGLMRVQLRYYLTILYFLLLFYCYLVGFEFRILVVGLSCLRLGCWLAIQVCFCSAFLSCLLFLFFTIFFLYLLFSYWFV